MITGKDLEDMGYYDMFDNDLKTTTLKGYSAWVEDKMVTKGKTRLIENTLGLVGEAGEVAEKVKKLLRDDTKLDEVEVLKELGDVLFYITGLANYFGGDLNFIMELNVKKLDDRQHRGKIKGSGDNR